MISKIPLIIFASILLVDRAVAAAPPTAAPPVSKEEGHAQMLEKRYPVPAIKVLMEMKVSQQLYQEAVNDAHAAGVPSQVLSELVAMRALKTADARTLELVLPSLKSEIGKYRPEASIFPDEESQTKAIQTIERVLQVEKTTPGTLVKRAKDAAEMGIARAIRNQLSIVDSAVDQEAIEKHLAIGTPVPEARWQSWLNKSTRLAIAGTDELGNRFGPQIVDTPPSVPKASYQRLKAVVPDSFWAPYGIPK